MHICTSYALVLHKPTVITLKPISANHLKAHALRILYFFDDFSLKQKVLHVVVLTKWCIMANYCTHVAKGTAWFIHINLFIDATKKMMVRPDLSCLGQLELKQRCSIIRFLWDWPVTSTPSWQPKLCMSTRCSASHSLSCDRHSNMAVSLNRVIKGRTFTRMNVIKEWDSRPFTGIMS